VAVDIRTPPLISQRTLHSCGDSAPRLPTDPVAAISRVGFHTEAISLECLFLSLGSLLRVSSVCFQYFPASLQKAGWYASEQKKRVPRAENELSPQPLGSTPLYSTSSTLFGRSFTAAFFVFNNFCALLAKTPGVGATTSLTCFETPTNMTAQQMLRPLRFLPEHDTERDS
jgi:hypothetical protein